MTFPSAAANRFVLGAMSAIFLYPLGTTFAAERPAAEFPAGTDRPGEVREATAPSPALGHAIKYYAYLPSGYDDARNSAPFPVLYLLHGRGDTMKAWLTIKTDLDQMIAAKQIPAVIAIMPDAPSNQRAGYYIDSEFAGSETATFSRGEKIETAFTADLVRHVDATFRTQSDRRHRVIGGYSMGGYGAMRYALAHSDVFGAAIILSPAVYFPQPPPQSSTREFGAFGHGPVLFDETIYRAKNYPATISTFAATRLPLFVFIGVGDDEMAQAEPSEASHDLDFEAHALYNLLRRVPGITAQFRVVDGGHNWTTWRPTFIEGARWIFRAMDSPATAAETPTTN